MYHWYAHDTCDGTKLSRLKFNLKLATIRIIVGIIRIIEGKSSRSSENYSRID